MLKITAKYARSLCLFSLLMLVFMRAFLHPYFSAYACFLRLYSTHARAVGSVEMLDVCLCFCRLCCRQLLYDIFFK